MIESDEPNLCAESDRASTPYRDLARRPSKFKKPAGFRLAGFLIIWHRPTLEGPCGPTTIGAGGLNCRVRDGNGWNPTAMGARNLIPMR